MAKSAPDGYTLLLGSSGTVTNAPAVYKNIAYDPVKDLTAIGPIQSVPMVLTAAPKTPVTNFAEFAAYAKLKPGQVNIASAGNGSSNHLVLDLLECWLPNDAVREPLFASNAARLYRFEKL